jgi:hypothetical protein
VIQNGLEVSTRCESVRRHRIPAEAAARKRTALRLRRLRIERRRTASILAQKAIVQKDLDEARLQISFLKNWINSVEPTV